jgi:hypothetical protein
MLIDSYALQDAVIKSAMPSQMLDGLKTLGVSGLGMVGGGMLKPIAKRPLVSLADWHGITFEAYRSEVGADAIRALGATPTDTLAGLPAGLDDGSIQGYARSLLTYQLNGNEVRAPFVTANVNLWPNMIVLVANPASLRGSPTSSGWLHQAAADDARAPGSGRSRGSDPRPSARRGAHARTPRTPTWPPAGVRSVTPGRTRPADKSFIEQIDTLKQSLPVGAPLSIPAGCSAAAFVAPRSRRRAIRLPVGGRRRSSRRARWSAFVAAGGDRGGHAFFRGLGSSRPDTTS